MNHFLNYLQLHTANKLFSAEIKKPHVCNSENEGSRKLQSNILRHATPNGDTSLIKFILLSYCFKLNGQLSLMLHIK